MHKMTPVYRWRLGEWRGYYVPTGPDGWAGGTPVRPVVPLGVPDPRPFTVSLDSAEDDDLAAEVDRVGLGRLLACLTVSEVETVLKDLDGPAEGG